MKTLSGMFILVLALYFSGCSTQTGGSSTSSASSISENSAQSTPASTVKNTSGSGGNYEGNTGPDASDSEIAWGPHN
jgi:hypothetical protein